MVEIEKAYKKINELNAKNKQKELEINETFYKFPIFPTSNRLHPHVALRDNFP